MSYAPQCLADLAAYTTHLFGLRPGDVGIVGDSAHLHGYHVGWDVLVKNDGWNDYSAQTQRDRHALTGPTKDAACAFDIVNTIPHNSEFLRALLADCRAGVPYTAGLRAFDCTLDGVSTYRFDREAGWKAQNADSSHLWHNHFEWYRDVIAGGLSQIQIFSEFYGGIMKLDPITVPASGITIPGMKPGDQVDQGWLALATYQHVYSGELQTIKAAAADQVRDAAILAAIAALSDAVKAGGGNVDTAAILAGVDASVAKVLPAVTSKVDAELARIAAAFNAASSGA